MAVVALIASFLVLCAVPADGEWHRCFAWRPVYVDAYDASEIKNGHMQYRVWMKWIDARIDRWTDDDDSRTAREAWRYRIAK